jgi:hypothetical protein
LRAPLDTLVNEVSGQMIFLVVDHLPETSLISRHRHAAQQPDAHDFLNSRECPWRDARAGLKIRPVTAGDVVVA